MLSGLCSRRCCWRQFYGLKGNVRVKWSSYDYIPLKITVHVRESLCQYSSEDVVRRIPVGHESSTSCYQRLLHAKREKLSSLDEDFSFEKYDKRTRNRDQWLLKYIGDMLMRNSLCGTIIGGEVSFLVFNPFALAIPWHHHHVCDTIVVDSLSWTSASFLGERDLLTFIHMTPEWYSLFRDIIITMCYFFPCLVLHYCCDVLFSRDSRS